jgi:hypothetical protein
MKDDSMQPLYLEMVMKILREAKDTQNGTRQKDEPLSQSPQMKVVSEVSQKFLEANIGVTST